MALIDLPCFQNQEYSRPIIVLIVVHVLIEFDICNTLTISWPFSRQDTHTSRVNMSTAITRSKSLLENNGFALFKPLLLNLMPIPRHWAMNKIVFQNSYYWRRGLHIINLKQDFQVDYLKFKKIKKSCVRKMISWFGFDCLEVFKDIYILLWLFRRTRPCFNQFHNFCNLSLFY